MPIVNRSTEKNAELNATPRYAYGFWPAVSAMTNKSPNDRCKTLFSASRIRSASTPTSWIKSIAIGSRQPRRQEIVLSGNSTRRNPMPVKLLPVAANAQVFEHRLAFELDLALVIRLVLDADLHPSLEVDELG